MGGNFIDTIMLEISLKQKAPLEEEIRAQFKYAYDTALLELADYLQQNSPRGVSPSGQSLAGSWDIKPARKVRGVIPEVLGTVVNTAEAAEFRIRGRAPGKFPPFGEGTSLEAWATAAGIPAYLVARSIALKGTERWRNKDNILKQDPITLKFNPDSPLHTIFEKRLREEWEKISL